MLPHVLAANRNPITDTGDRIRVAAVRFGNG